MSKYILIDGYNIINAWGYIQKEPGHSLEDTRDKLINSVAEYALFTGQEAWIVFDAQKQRNAKVSKEVILGVHVVYTKDNQTADSFIEVKVKELASKRRNEVRVATSDWAEQQVVMGIGAARISARELKIEMNQISTEIVKKRKALNNKRTLLSDRIDEAILQELERWRDG